jgi:3,4-dihydroxy 2-butanone 4-phosphate synthase/GTP cyclohydrolase II
VVKRVRAYKVAEHDLEHMSLGRTRVFVYRQLGDIALAMRYGDCAGAVPVRIQSACVYGEVLGAADCDCRTQLDETFRVFEKAQSGILIYLYQEGRGAGLTVKARAYELQDDETLDTVDAYRRLGVEADQRNYDIAASILQDLRITSIKLLTNNARKVNQLRRSGIDVERNALTGAITRHNQSYLRVKQEKLGHMLGL